ncbi:hypothetical protein O4H49_12880 [Kiloniella laminariae]|uniref:Uncharacterized protein n=1 Tax=Kiloniella laminariae TaxID=454162 RepID=A0ABT4LKN6_9PROT|nr:hypothetical protein [Kiloniella laminariae]MCZ4281677.1 hypothetical protein [Kiloniella laminariae]
MSNIKLPPYSEAAHHGAHVKKSSMAMLITYNATTGQFDYSCYGANERFRCIAGLLAEASSKAVRNLPPPDAEVLFKTLSSEIDQGGL